MGSTSPVCSAITYVVSHRYTILRNGVGSFDDFLKQGATEGAAVRRRKWEWIQHGIEAPRAAAKIRLYDTCMHKMERALQSGAWLVGDRFSMADVAMAPYVNRLAALSTERMWRYARLPRVEDSFARVRMRPTFEPAFVHWMPQDLSAEMKRNGERSWPRVQALLDIA